MRLIQGELAIKAGLICFISSQEIQWWLKQKGHRPPLATQVEIENSWDGID